MCEGDGRYTVQSRIYTSRPTDTFFSIVPGVMSKVGAAMVESMPKPKGQAKLGDENTMFYDEKRGRWVEPGKEGEADAGPLAPPPTMWPGGMGSGTTGGRANQGQSPGGYELPL